LGVGERGGQLGQRLHQAVGHHREQRQLVRGLAPAPPLLAAEDLADAEFFPERPHNVDRPQQRAHSSAIFSPGAASSAGVAMPSLQTPVMLRAKRSSPSRRSASARPPFKPVMPARR
jgi:hypothetical protein